MHTKEIHSNLQTSIGTMAVLFLESNGSIRATGLGADVVGSSIVPPASESRMSKRAESSMGGRGRGRGRSRTIRAGCARRGRCVREAEHDGGASLDGDEGAEFAARPVDLAQVVGVHHRGRHDRRSRDRGAVMRRAACVRANCGDVKEDNVSDWPRNAGAGTFSQSVSYVCGRWADHGLVIEAQVYLAHLLSGSVVGPVRPTNCGPVGFHSGDFLFLFYF
jgi:hypothetical protein